MAQAGGIDIAARLAEVRAGIATAASEAGRAAQTVTLVAVSKTHPASAVTTALAAGQKVFGENRVQEAPGKFSALKAAQPALHLHLSRPLQTNKVRDAPELIDVIETIHRPTPAREIGRASC